MTKKICFVSHYIPKHTGGGEKYLLDCALATADSFEVYVAVPGTHTKSELISFKKKYQLFMDDSLDNITFISTPLFTTASFLTKLWWTRSFNVLYYQTDGSLFFSLAKKNILHIQIPLKNVSWSFIDRLKFKNWHVVNTNSEFTKKIVEKYWKIKVDLVHWPMVSLPSKKTFQKKKVILHVGRFYRQLHSKKQKVLVNIFKKLRQRHSSLVKNWKLVLIGPVEDQSYADEVKKLAKGEPIEIVHTISRKNLLNWFSQATFYWHATGFGLDEEEFPEKMEHFGITTIEAMSYGCVPVVIGLGGQKEILGSDLQNLTWQTKDECIKITADLLKNQKQRKVIQTKVLDRVSVFGKDRFKKQLESMINA